jgi:hypothetical protein
MALFFLAPLLFCLFPLLFFLFFAPLIRLFSARDLSFAISMAFAAFGAHRRPVNRLYFFHGLLDCTPGLHPCGETRN